MKLQLNTDFLNQNVLLAVLAAAQVKGETIEVEPVEESRFYFVGRNDMIEEVTLMTPEGPVAGVIAICQYLLKETPLVANCTYLEKSQVRISVDGIMCVGVRCCLQKALRSLRWRPEGCCRELFRRD